jgi:hypothetical protein
VNIKQTIITSNILSVEPIEIVLDIKPLVFMEDTFITNVAIVVINYLISQNITKVELVGLDGYKINIDNYNYHETSVVSDNKALIEENKILSNALKIINKNIELIFLTPNIFEKELNKC